MKLYNSLRYNYQYGGLRKILKKTYIRIKEFFYFNEKYVIYKYNDLNNYIFDTNVSYDVNELFFDELVILRYEKAIYYPDVILKRFKKGEKCYGLFVNNQIAHFAWLTNGYLHCSFNFSNITINDSAGIYDCVTLPDYRQKGMYKYMLCSLLEKYAGKVKCIYIAVHPFNYASIKGIESVGFDKLHLITFTRVFFKGNLSKSMPPLF